MKINHSHSNLNQIKLFESLSMNAWPALTTLIVDGWIVRFANGYTKRSNSITPLYQGSLHFQEKLKFCKNLYEQQSLPLIFKLTPLASNLAIDQNLDSLGFSVIDKSSVQMLSISKSSQIFQNYKNSKNFSSLPIISEDWKKEFIFFQNLNPSFRTTMDKMLQSIKPLHWFYILYENIDDNKSKAKSAVACSIGVLQMGYYGIFDVVVHPKYRRRGFGRKLMLNMLAHAQNQNAHTVFLQVVKNNKAAWNLYAELGFKEIYEYWYRKSMNK
ncbi:MAG: GNAT family N-acetyltransferase [Candidatus Lokiarchaeota archaeon]|nr:GNAT family N-acetyltransferase [Candidatus Harpocratesius repetitus]